MAGQDQGLGNEMANNGKLTKDEFGFLGIAGDSDDLVHRVQLPHDLEAERSVIAALLRDNHKLDELEFALTGDDFYADKHRFIYEHIVRLKGQEGKPADVITVVSALKDTDLLERVGGKEYIVELESLADIATNFSEYVQLVRDKSTLRRLMAETEIIRRGVHAPGEQSCGVILDDAERRVFSVSNNYRNRRRDSMRRIEELTKPIDKQVRELYELVAKGGKPITGLATQFASLDLLTSGLQPSDLIILAARPSIGKTAFALDLLRNISKEVVDDKRVHASVLFSLEMSAEQITKRMIGMEGKIDQHKLRTGRIHEAKEWKNFMLAQGEIERWPLWIDDTPMLTVMELRARARRIQRIAEGNGEQLKLIVVDYLQLMDAENRNVSENRATEVSQISRGLKALARELQVPVLALSQLSRKIEDRRSQRPQLSDLRESGAIEQDADVIMFLSRAHHPEGPGDQSVEDEEVELIVGKHRNGPTGKILFSFDKRFTHFREVPDKSGYDPNDPPPRTTDRGEPGDYKFNS